MEDIKGYISEIFEDGARKLVLSKPAGKAPEFKKITVALTGDYYQLSKYTEKQVFHENLAPEAALARCVELMEGRFLQLNAWSEDKEFSLMVSKKGKASFKVKKATAPPDCRREGHNRQKDYILREGQIIEPLIDMGVFTKEGRIVQSMYAKYRQINRFIEIIDDAIRQKDYKKLNIVDFGCGKSYLTFIVYYYLTEIKSIDVNIVGLDLKEDVIEKCSAAAKKYGYSGLRFELGDINGYDCPFDVDMVISLHACDTATDYALYNAVAWKAKMIFSVPCCQHELNRQLSTEKLSLLTRYGLVQERFSALLTDAIRGNLLEYAGYKAQLLEFIDLEHTPKNILIRAILKPNPTPASKEKALREAQNAMEEFHVEPTL